MRTPKVVLCILDGVGYRTDERREIGNAVIGAHPAYYESLFRDYPFTTLNACGHDVGLPDGQMGNSEVGHLTIGAGRIMDQELVRISQSIADGEFKQRAVWTEFIARAKQGNGRLHLLGLVSEGGVHSHTDHLKGILAAAKEAGLKEVFVHAFLDGRDTAPRSGHDFLASVIKTMDDLGVGQIASVCGRYWAMDRDKRWDRLHRAWRLLVDGEVDDKGATTTDPLAAITASYEAGVTDEFCEPTLVTNTEGQPVATIGEGDSIFYWNFRADRARELTWAFQSADFEGFDVSARPATNFLMMTPYDEKMDLPFVFQPQRPRDGLAEVLAAHDLTNLRTAETEKYAHVTYFFNGGREKPYPGEDRQLVPSPKVATYDLQPEMSAPEVAAIVNAACQGDEYDVVIVNFANGDMVGHTGVYDAAVEAIKTLDRLLSEIMPPSLARGTVWLVTADHGNCDEMIGPDGATLTQHSLFKVPFIVAAERFAGQSNLLKEGHFGLADIAPTILDLLGLPQPEKMTGQSIIADHAKL